MDVGIYVMHAATGDLKFAKDSDSEEVKALADLVIDATENALAHAGVLHEGDWNILVSGDFNIFGLASDERCRTTREMRSALRTGDR